MGMEDQVVPYAGGPSRVLPREDCFMPAEEGARVWAQHNKAKLEPSITISERTGNRLLEWSNDAHPHARVVHIGIFGSGHKLNYFDNDEEIGITEGLLGFMW